MEPKLPVFVAAADARPHFPKATEYEARHAGPAFGDYLATDIVYERPAAQEPASARRSPGLPESREHEEHSWQPIENGPAHQHVKDASEQQDSRLASEQAQEDDSGKETEADSLETEAAGLEGSASEKTNASAAHASGEEEAAVASDDPEGIWIEFAAGLVAPTAEPSLRKQHVADGPQAAEPRVAVATSGKEEPKSSAGLGAAAGEMTATIAAHEKDPRKENKESNQELTQGLNKGSRAPRAEAQEMRAAQTVAAVEGLAVDSKANEKRAPGFVEVDGRTWRVHTEQSAGDPLRSETGKSDSGHHSAYQGDDSRRKQSNKQNDLRVEDASDRSHTVMRRTAGLSDLANELKPAAARTATASDANRERFADLIDRARVNLGSDGKSTASIQLNPQHLGRMTLNLELHEGRLQAKVLVDNPEAERMLRQDVDALRRDLRAHGIQLESFAIRLREPTASFETRPDSDQQSGSAQTADNPNGRSSRERGDDNAETRPMSFLDRFDSDALRDTYEDNGVRAEHEERLLNVSA